MFNFSRLLAEEKFEFQERSGGRSCGGRLKMGFLIHFFMQNANNLDTTDSLLAVKNDMPTGKKFAVSATDLVTSLALARIVCQGMEITVKKFKVMTALVTPPALLGITTNLAKILKRLLGERK
jgi:hypothetical protein